MINPVNTSLEDFIRKKFKIPRPQVGTPVGGVTIITCTNRPNSLKNILKNYFRQEYKEKELIIIINNNKINVVEWRKTIRKCEDIRIYKLDDNLSLGKCLNFGVDKSKYDLIGKFDDDDYYGPKYLSDSLNYFNSTDSDIIGKHTIFVYFVEDKILAVKDNNHENQNVYFVNGATLIFKKKIFERVRFRNISVNEDVLFCRDSISKGFRVYSGNKYHFVYLRYAKSHKHTWKVENQKIMDLFCSEFQRVDAYKKFIDIDEVKV